MDKTINKHYKKLKKFKESGILKHISAISGHKKKHVYLVGGVLRDLFLKHSLNKKIIDWDFAVRFGALELAKKAAHSLNGHYVVLDKINRTARVIYAENNQEFRLDFTDFRAKTLKGDLKKRDFTINSLCIDIEDLLQGNVQILDYFKAIEDIKYKKLRSASKDNFKDDPLRILRGFVFCCQWGFCFDINTAKLVKSNVFRILDVSPERVSEELAKIFGSKSSYKYVRTMDEFKVLDELFPEIEILRGIDQGLFHHLDVWDHSLESLAQLEKLLRVLPRKIPGQYAKKVNEYLACELCGNRSRLWILKLACLLHDIAKPQTKFVGDDQRVHFYTHEKQGSLMVKKIGKRLKLSGKETSVLSNIVLNHLRAGQLVNRRPSKRAKFRFIRDTGDNAVMILLLTIADRWAMQGILSKSKSFIFYEDELLKMISDIFKQQDSGGKAIKLLDGNQVMSLLGLSKGPLVGKILGKIEEAQAIKSIRNKQQAEDLAKQLYLRMRQ